MSEKGTYSVQKFVSHAHIYLLFDVLGFCAVIRALIESSEHSAAFLFRESSKTSLVPPRRIELITRLIVTVTRLIVVEGLQDAEFMFKHPALNFIWTVFRQVNDELVHNRLRAAAKEAQEEDKARR